MKKILLIVIILLALVGCKNTNRTPGNKNSASEIIHPKGNAEITEDIVGRWETVSAIKADSDETTDNLESAFGFVVEPHSSYFELNADGTFTDSTKIKLKENDATTGTFEIAKDFYIVGDYYVLLHYSDGSEWKLRKYIDDNNTPYLVFDKIINGYKITLMK